MVNSEVEKILPLVQKPARYIGNELNSIVKDKSKVDVRWAFCFPDIYEIGMSHLGMKILYGALNSEDNFWCERVFAPDSDMENIMRERSIPLFALESGDPVSEFDIIGFTLQYELCYTNVLNMLSLAGIPLRSSQRTQLKNLVCVGGPCACNPEPIADFVDVVMTGEGEESIVELTKIYARYKKEGRSKDEFLRAVCTIDGIYVPKFYEVEYNSDSTVKSVFPKPGTPAPARVKKRIVEDFDKAYFPESFVVPYISIVHDRATAEVFRGCIRGCRFCQACFIYRPIREKSEQTINRQAKSLCDTTGYDEISLCSLSTSDYSKIEKLLPEMIDWTSGKNINLSLPSLRVDNFSDELVEQLSRIRRSGLTFAPEAGTQRLRDAINKNVTEQEVLNTCEKAFRGGWTSVKLYFMIGLPTETMEDVKGIADLANKVVDLFYSIPDIPKGRGVSVSVSCSSFIPKPFTPFQWEAVNDGKLLKEKQEYLLSNIKSKKISVSYHDTRTSFMEGVLAKGSRKLCDVIEKAYYMGCKFDAWDDKFDFDKWMRAFKECGVDPSFFANRVMDESEVLPWEHLDYGVSREFFIRERKKAYETTVSPHCRIRCNACGADKLCGGKCDARN